METGGEMLPSNPKSPELDKECRYCGEWYPIDKRLNDGYCNDCRVILNSDEFNTFI